MSRRASVGARVEAVVDDFEGRPGRLFAALEILEGLAVFEAGNLISQLFSTILAGIDTILRR